MRPEVYEALKHSGVTVVTQPGFLADRGDSFLRAADPKDRDYIYPFASLVAAGIPVVASSDAPYGPLDPWRIMQAAVDRCTETGDVLTAAEQVPPSVALRGYLTAARNPGGRPRELREGEPADLIVLDRPLAAAYEHLAETQVLYTFVDGRCIYSAINP